MRPFGRRPRQRRLVRRRHARRPPPPEDPDDGVDERGVDEGDQEFQEVLADQELDEHRPRQRLPDPEDQRGGVERHGDEDGGVDGLAGRRRPDVAQPEPRAVGQFGQAVKDQDVPVLADDVGQQAPCNDIRPRAEHRPVLPRYLRIRRRREDGAPDQREQDEVHREGDVDEHLGRPLAVQFGVAVGREEGERVGQRRPGQEDCVAEAMIGLRD